MRQEMLTKTERQGEPDHLLGAAARLAEPDAHAESRRASTSWRSSTPRSGPVVLEIPPGDADGSLNGNIVNVWQMPLEDAGLLGVDKGEGGKYPGPAARLCGRDARRLHRAAVRHVRQLRAVALEPEEPRRRRRRKSVAYGKRIKVYPLVAGGQSARDRVHRRKDVAFDSTIRYDASFFESLDRIVQASRGSTATAR